MDGKYHFWSENIACRIVFIYKIFIAVIQYTENDNLGVKVVSVTIRLKSETL